MALNSFLSLKKDTLNPEKLYRLRTEWDDRRCNITIFVEAMTDAYRGQISDEQVKRISKALNYTEEEYVEECKNALRPDLDDDRFSYQLDGDSFIIRKKVKEKKSMKRIVANIKLEKVDFHETFFEIFDQVMKQITVLNTDFRNLKTKNESIERYHQEAVQRLEEMDQMKTESDKVLYARFLSLLNSKKTKIAKLEKYLSELRNRMGGSEAAGLADMDYASSDDSAYSVDTDDMEATRGEPSPSKPAGEEPSTSRVARHEPSPMEAQYEEPTTPEALRDTPSPSEFQTLSEHSPVDAMYEAQTTSGAANDTPSPPSKMVLEEPSPSESREVTDEPKIKSEVDAMSGVEQNDLTVPSDEPDDVLKTNRTSYVESRLEDDLFDPTVRLKKS